MKKLSLILILLILSQNIMAENRDLALLKVKETIISLGQLIDTRAEAIRNLDASIDLTWEGIGTTSSARKFKKDLAELLAVSTAFSTVQAGHDVVTELKNRGINPHAAKKNIVKVAMVTEFPFGLGKKGALVPRLWTYSGAALLALIVHITGDGYDREFQEKLANLVMEKVELEKKQAKSKSLHKQLIDYLSIEGVK